MRAADLADDRQVGQRLQPLDEIRADLADMAAEMLALDDREAGQRGGTGDGVGGIGEAVGELWPLAPGPSSRA